MPWQKCKCHFWTTLCNVVLCEFLLFFYDYLLGKCAYLSWMFGRNRYKVRPRVTNKVVDTNSRGVNHLFRRIIFSIQRHGYWFLKNCILFLWSEEIIVIIYNLVSFAHKSTENISVLTKCNVLLNNEHLILIWFFSFIDNEFDVKTSLRIWNPEIIKYI